MVAADSDAPPCRTPAEAPGATPQAAAGGGATQTHGGQPAPAAAPAAEGGGILHSKNDEFWIGNDAFVFQMMIFAFKINDYAVTRAEMFAAGGSPAEESFGHLFGASASPTAVSIDAVCFVYTCHRLIDLSSCLQVPAPTPTSPAAVHPPQVRLMYMPRD